MAPLAVLGVLFALTALVLRARFTGAAVFILAVEYTIVEVTDRVGSLSIVAYAVGLVVLCELLLWFGRLPTRGLADASAVVGQLRGIGLLGLAAALLALVALAAAGLRIPGALAGTIAGSAAAIILLALPRFLVTRRGNPRQGERTQGRDRH